MSFAKVRRVAACGVSALAFCQGYEAVAQEAPGAGDDTEIVVTATKREQSVRDIAGSVSAVSEATLQKLNAQSLADYITRVPGVVFNDYQPGVSEVVMRGVASTTYHEANQATTGYYLNELPLAEPGFPLVIPDIDSFDVNRVEVLRGPQGTLFGSSSLGGAVNYVVNEADPTRFDAGFEGMVSTTRHAGGDVGYAVKGMVNLPIVTDRLAVRVVALQRFDAGYLNNPFLGEKGSNDLRVRGLRGSIVFTPTETTRISALSMYQEYDLDDQTFVIFGPKKTFDRPNTVAEYQDTDFMMHSLKLEQELGFATLTALGSYTEKNSNLLFDYAFGNFDPRTKTPLVGIGVGKSKTHYAELRLTSRGESRFRWLVGANYTRLRGEGSDREELKGIGAYIDAHPAEFGGQPGSVIAPGDADLRNSYINRVTEKAVFGEASFDIVDKLTLTLGGRLFEYRTQSQVTLLPNARKLAPFHYAPAAETQSGFIPKASLTFKPNNDFMAYVLYSEGFRIGGLNAFAMPYPDLPKTFGSDKTRNYEIGTRFDVVSGTFTVDLTAYHIDWANMQARLFTPGPDQRAYTVNGGGADIDGVELSLSMRPTRNLTFSSNISYNDARLSAPLPDQFAPGGAHPKGSRLPGASEWLLANSIDLNFPDSPLKPRLGFAHRYHSAAPVAFGSVFEKGDFHVVDLNASITIAKRYELGVFAKNLFDQYGILSAPFTFAGSVARPRTVGATLRFRLN